MKMRLGRRRTLVAWFVEPYRQIKLGLMFLIVNFVFSLSILLVFGYYLLDVYRTMTVYFNLSGVQGAQVLDKFSWPIIAAICLIVLFVLVTILVSVRYTFAIYGPLVSIHRFLDDILDAKATKPLVLRESDQLKDLAKKLNLVAEMFSDQRKTPLLVVHKFLDDLLKGDMPAPLKMRESDNLNELAEKLNKLALIMAQDKLKNS